MCVWKPFVNRETKSTKHTQGLCVYMCGHYSLTQFTERRQFFSQRHLDLKKKNDTCKSRRIKVNEIKRSHATLKKILGSLPGPLQELSLGPGPILPIMHSFFFHFFSIETTLFPEELSFPTGSFHSSAPVAWHWGGREGGRLKGKEEKWKWSWKGREGGRAALYVHWKLVCQVIVNQGLYVYPTILTTIFKKVIQSWHFLNVMFSYKTQPWQDVKGTAFVAKIWFVPSRQITNSIGKHFLMYPRNHFKIHLQTGKVTCIFYTLPLNMGRKDINKNP